MSVNLIEVGSPAFDAVLQAAVEKAIQLTREQLERDMKTWDFISKEEAMQLLHCKESKLWNLCSTREIGVSGKGKDKQFSRSSILAYLQRRYIPSRHEPQLVLKHSKTATR